MVARSKRLVKRDLRLESNRISKNSGECASLENSTKKGIVRSNTVLFGYTVCFAFK